MKVEMHDYCLVVTREDSDSKFYKESLLFHAIKKHLNVNGGDFIKKLMHKDGHMVSDDQHCLRSRNAKAKDAVCIYSNFHALRGIHEDFNEGRLILNVHALNAAPCDARR